MGFFSFLGDCIDWVHDKVSDGINFVKDKISTIIDTFNDDIASENSYDIDEASISTTERLNSLLVEFSEEYLKNAIGIETACVNLVEQYYEQFTSVIEKRKNIGYSKTAIRRLRSNSVKIKKVILHSIRDPLKKRLSLDDSECLEILKMESGESKKRKMEDFVKKVIGEALDNLADTVRESLDMQLEELEEGFMEIAEKQEKEYVNLKKCMDSFSKTSEDEIEEREKNCVLPVLILDASEEVLQLIA